MITILSLSRNTDKRISSSLLYHQRLKSRDRGFALTAIKETYCSEKFSRSRQDVSSASSLEKLFNVFLLLEKPEKLISDISTTDISFEPFVLTPARPAVEGVENAELGLHSRRDCLKHHQDRLDQESLFMIWAWWLFRCLITVLDDWILYGMDNE